MTDHKQSPAAAKRARSLFGTDGVRGPAGTGPLSPEALVRLGLAVAAEVRERRGGRAARSPRAITGRDTRLSGPALSAAFSAGLLAGGVEVFDAGVLPTPAVAMLTREAGFDLGVVVSASHNEWHDNGIKLLGDDGGKLPDEREARIEEILAAGPEAHPGAMAATAAISDGPAHYAAAMRREFRRLRLGGMRVVVDAANGAQSGIATEVLTKLGAKVTALHDAPDGRNINADCGALHPKPLARAVRAAKAAIGIAFDGDADRVQLCDETGRLLDGDAILATLAPAFLAADRLPGATVVGTSMTNGALEALLREQGIALHRTDVGDRHILAAMRSHGFGLGGEPSGHILFPFSAETGANPRLEGLLTGDGLRAALAILAAMKSRGVAASEVAGGYRPWPLAIESIVVRAKTPVAALPKTSAAIAAAESALGGAGRVVVRYSGTEPKLRVMVEARTKRALAAAIGPIAAAVREEVGVR